MQIGFSYILHVSENYYGFTGWSETRRVFLPSLQTAKLLNKNNKETAFEALLIV